MASGYVVAAFLELAGLVGLVVAAVRMRTERQEKAAELRGFLRSGQSASSSLGTAEPRRAALFGSRLSAIPVVPSRGFAGPQRDSAARSALGRAIIRTAHRTSSDLTAPLSAG
jgi:hypothetical protein